ncbi:hypothetical protein [Paraburkholderia aspalathi]|jgi:hypothetical protein|nr:hypothetical protein [Paraburkholderia aspalathi]
MKRDDSPEHRVCQEKSPSEEQTGQEAEMNFNWVAMCGAWRRISAGSRRWLDEAIRLRGQAEAVYFFDDGDWKRSSASDDGFIADTA